VLRRAPHPDAPDRLSPIDARVLEQVVRTIGALAEPPLDELRVLRAMYEPYVWSLSEHLMMPLPAWAGASASDNWRTSAWERDPLGPAPRRRDGHDED
jgi:hypothetical protein